MSASTPHDAGPLLLDLRPFERDRLADDDAWRRLVHLLLDEFTHLPGWVLFRLLDGDLLEPVHLSGFSGSTVDDLARALEGAAPWRSRGAGRFAAATCFEENPADLVAPGEPAPDHVIVLGSRDDLTGVLILSGTANGSETAPSSAVSDVIEQGLRLQRETTGILRSYEFVRSILRDVSTGLVAIDPLGRVIFLNAAAEQILGTSVGEAMGADAVRVFRTLVEGENILLEGLTGDLPTMEVWLRRSDGRELPVELRLSRIRPRDGKVLGVVGTFQDISEMRSLQERLRHRDRLATIGELAAGIAHEIGNPLTGIRGCAQILRDRLPAEDDSQELIRVILEEVDRLHRLSQQVRHYVRPNAPRMQRRSVVPMLERVVALVQPAADEFGIAIHASFAPGTPEIYHDPDQITQVLQNLLTNAVQAMSEGGRLEIDLKPIKRPATVRARRSRRAGDRDDEPRPGAEREFVRVCVADTGPGLSAEDQERIFNPFYTTKPDGLGLGLSISQTIVGEHSGFLSVVSQVGKGTTFILDLPVDRRAQ